MAGAAGITPGSVEGDQAALSLHNELTRSLAIFAIVLTRWQRRKERTAAGREPQRSAELPVPGAAVSLEGLPVINPEG